MKFKIEFDTGKNVFAGAAAGAAAWGGGGGGCMYWGYIGCCFSSGMNLAVKVNGKLR